MSDTLYRKIDALQAQLKAVWNEADHPRVGQKQEGGGRFTESGGGGGAAGGDSAGGAGGTGAPAKVSWPSVKDKVPPPGKRVLLHYRDSEEDFMDINMIGEDGKWEMGPDRAHFSAQPYSWTEMPAPPSFKDPGNWVSARSGKFPDEGLDVLVYARDGVGDKGVWVDNGMRDSASRSPDKFRWEYFEGVSHWQELPAPPPWKPGERGNIPDR